MSWALHILAERDSAICGTNPLRIARCVTLIFYFNPTITPSLVGKPKDVDEEKDTDASSAGAGAGAGVGVGSSDTANMNFMHKNAFQDPPSGNAAASEAFDGPTPPGGLEMKI